VRYLSRNKRLVALFAVLSPYLDKAVNRISVSERAGKFHRNDEPAEVIGWFLGETLVGSSRVLTSLGSPVRRVARPCGEMDVAVWRLRVASTGSLAKLTTLMTISWESLTMAALAKRGVPTGVGRSVPWLISLSST